jgi:hypothetical protein
VTSLLSVGITTAVTAALGPVFSVREPGPSNLLVQGNFVGGTGGSAVTCWVQTSIDGGATWIDIVNFHFANSAVRAIYNLSSATVNTSAVTPTDGSLGNNSAVDGILGSQFRTKLTTTGTYSATTLQVDVATVSLHR